jgi:hypothetical protein
MVRILKSTYFSSFFTTISKTPRDAFVLHKFQKYQKQKLPVIYIYFFKFTQLNVF